MNIDFPALMKGKSDEAVQKYIDDYTKYQPEAIEAAIDELRSRGRVFSSSELENLARLPEQQRKNIEIREKEILDNAKLDINVVTDGTAPILYSQTAVFGSTVFLGAITGAILLTINIRRLKRSKGIFPTLIFGSLYTLFQVWVLVGYVIKETATQSARPLQMFMGVGTLGAIILIIIFWNKYIGKSQKYRSV